MKHKRSSDVFNLRNLKRQSVVTRCTKREGKEKETASVAVSSYCKIAIELRLGRLGRPKKLALLQECDDRAANRRQLCEPEVENLGMSTLGDANVGGLDVTVDNTFVRLLWAAGYCGEREQCNGLRKVHGHPTVAVQRDMLLPFLSLKSLNLCGI